MCCVKFRPVGESGKRRLLRCVVSRFCGECVTYGESGKRWLHYVVLRFAVNVL